MRSLALLLLLATACSCRPQHRQPKPEAIIELPAELHEISGLTVLGKNRVACIQDEDAILYVLDMHTGKILERHPFGPPGDMEGLTKVGNDLYAMRSDGLVYQVQEHDDRYATVDSFMLNIPHRNLEGLCFDERNGLVLVAPKDIVKGGPQERDGRAIYAFSPATHKMLDQPVLNYSVAQVLKDAEAHGVRIPMRKKGHGKEIPRIKLRMSSIAVDPVSDHYYILSAVDQTLLVLDRQGKYVALHLLDPDLLPQPEGITFLPDGDMLISTEGKKGTPRMVRYAKGQW